nr:hypothetical protein [Verminephrobacter eiseniae]
MAKSFRLLKIIEIEVTERKPENHQSENVIFNEKYIRTVKDYDKNQFANLCDNERLILGNSGKAISRESIRDLNHSLLLVSPTRFEVTQRAYENRPGKPQTRLVFTYNDNSYDFPITDPVFLDLHKRNADFLKQTKQIYLTLSLGLEWESWYYKLVAAITRIQDLPDSRTLKSPLQFFKQFFGN